MQEAEEREEEREVVERVKPADLTLTEQIEAQEELNQAEWERRMGIYLAKQEKVVKKSKA